MVLDDGVAPIVGVLLFKLMHKSAHPPHLCHGSNVVIFNIKKGSNCPM